MDGRWRCRRLFRHRKVHGQVKPGLTAAAVAVVSITAAAVAYIVKGSVPDVLALIATTSVGGYLGLTIPTPAPNK
jgi:hypothetical protein